MSHCTSVAGEQLPPFASLYLPDPDPRPLFPRRPLRDGTVRSGEWDRNEIRELALMNIHFDTESQICAAFQYRLPTDVTAFRRSDTFMRTLSIVIKKELNKRGSHSKDGCFKGPNDLLDGRQLIWRDSLALARFEFLRAAFGSLRWPELLGIIPTSVWMSIDALKDNALKEVVRHTNVSRVTEPQMPSSFTTRNTVLDPSTGDRVRRGIDWHIWEDEELAGLMINYVKHDDTIKWFSYRGIEGVTLRKDNVVFQSVVKQMAMQKLASAEMEGKSSHTLTAPRWRDIMLCERYYYSNWERLKRTTGFTNAQLFSITPNSVKSKMYF